MKKLHVHLTHSPAVSVPVGRLAEVDRRIYFEYDPAFIQSGVQLSPFKWPLRSGLIEHTDLSFGPLPGLFDDSLPDGWGLILMERHFRRQNIDVNGVSVLDRLAYLGTRTMGALTYHPSIGVDRDERQLDLYALGKNAAEVMSGDAATVLPALMRAGGSPGGARPKVLVGVRGDQIISGEDDLSEGYEHWIVKFAAKADDHEAGPLEYAYARMAQAAGIDLPPTRLFEANKGKSVRRYFGVKRFDRLPGNHRVHVHTFANLIHVNFRIPSTDYQQLFQATQALTRNHRDVAELFRRMVFNVASHNRDDHAKNFAFLLLGDGDAMTWSLSPAYDLICSQGPGGEHTMTLLGEGRNPTRDHCLKLAERFGIKKRQAAGIIERVNAAVADWPRFAGEAECKKTTIKKVAAVIRPL